MSFPKLHPHILSTFERVGISEPTPFQEKIIPLVKSGKNVFGIGPDGIGKSTAIIISVLNKLKCEAFQEIPRAIIFVKDKAACLELEEAFKPFIFRTDLRVFSAFEEHKIENQKNLIWDGVDILIGTPKRLSKLFFINGINLNSLNLFILDDAEFLKGNTHHVEIIRMSESVQKCQFLVFGQEEHNRFDRLRETFMQKSVQVGKSNT